MNSREAFERWAEREGFSISRAANYREWETRALWEAWQLATERAATICAAMGDSSSVEYAGHGCVVAADKIREGNE